METPYRKNSSQGLGHLYNDLYPDIKSEVFRRLKSIKPSRAINGPRNVGNFNKLTRLMARENVIDLFRIQSERLCANITLILYSTN
jgi:hypothetical protein